MINSTQFNGLISLAVLAAGVLVSVKPVQALTITRSSFLTISGNVTLTGIGVEDPTNGEPLTTLDFLTFDDFQPEFPSIGEFVITDGTGSFAAFNSLPFETGVILDLPTILDFEPNDPISVANALAPTEDFLTFSEPEFLVNFDLESLGAPLYVLPGGRTIVVIAGTGNFDSDESSDVEGQIILAVEFADISGDEVRSTFRSGGSLTGEFTSSLIVTEPIPEPSFIVSLVTLGLMGTGFLPRQKK